MPACENREETDRWRGTVQTGMGRKLSSDELDALYTASKPMGGYIQRADVPRRWTSGRVSMEISPLWMIFVLMVRGVRLSLRAAWWVLRMSAIGTAYGCQVWWWILTGRGDPLELALDVADTR